MGFHHARLLRDLPGVRLAGIYDIDETRADRVADELDTVTYPALDELLECSHAVVIAVPTSSHFEVGKKALEAGCDVLIEKPITVNTVEADELIRLGAEHGRIIQVGHIERFNGAVRACEAYLEEPLFVESHRLAPFVRRGTDVTVVLDLMIHDIDLILSLMRRPVAEVRAVGVPVISRRVDIANARLEFAGGAVANITASRVSITRQRKVRFFQPSGYISLDLEKGTGEFYRCKRDPNELGGTSQLSDYLEHIRLRSDGREPLRLELEAFSAAVRREAPVPVSGKDGRMALAVALEIIERIERHQSHVIDPNPPRTKAVRVT